MSVRLTRAVSDAAGSAASHSPPRASSAALRQAQRAAHLDDAGPDDTDVDFEEDTISRSRRSRSRSSKRALPKKAPSLARRNSKSSAAAAEEDEDDDDSPVPAVSPPKKKGGRTASPRGAPVAAASASRQSGRRGSAKKKRAASPSPERTASPANRKGSDARREEQATYHATEATRLKKLFDEDQLRREQQQKQQSSKSSLCWWISFTSVSLAIPVILFLIAFAAEMPDLLPAFLAPFLHSAARASILEQMQPLHSALEQHSTLSQQTRSRVEEAIAAHAEGFALRAAVSSGRAADASLAVDEGGAQWMEGSATILAAQKPLVIVLAASPGSYQASRLTELLSVELQNGAQPLPTLNLAEALDRRWGLDRSGAMYAPALTARHVRVLLTEFFTSPSSEGFASLAAGLVLVPSASSLPRAAAEAFHQLVDDVAAPVRNAAYFFEVTLAGSQAGADASDAVRRELTRAWAKTDAKQREEDEVLLPLTSRILRNIVDVRQ